MEQLKKRLNEIEKNLEPLYVLSAKLKHLQLNYNQYETLLKEVRQREDNYPQGDSLDEFYILQFERMIIEIISSVFSIRDCLKNKILAIDPQTQNVNGKLCEKYKQHQINYDKILKETLDFNDRNRNIKKIASALRNFLIHNSLHITTFLTVFLSTHGAKAHCLFILVANYQHLANKLEEKFSQEIFCQYYLDKDILILLSNHGALTSENHKKILNRLKRLGLNDLKKKFLKAIENQSVILLQASIYQQEIYMRPPAELILYREIADNNSYRFQVYNEKLASNEKEMYFDLERAIYDIYHLYLKYYTKLHDLIKQHHAQELIEMERLHTELGYLKENIARYQKKFGYTIPELPRYLVHDKTP